MTSSACPRCGAVADSGPGGAPARCFTCGLPLAAADRARPAPADDDAPLPVVRFVHQADLEGRLLEVSTPPGAAEETLTNLYDTAGAPPLPDERGTNLVPEPAARLDAVPVERLEEPAARDAWLPTDLPPPAPAEAPAAGGATREPATTRPRRPTILPAPPLGESAAGAAPVPRAETPAGRPGGAPAPGSGSPASPIPIPRVPLILAPGPGAAVGPTPPPLPLPLPATATATGDPRARRKARRGRRRAALGRLLAALALAALGAAAAWGWWAYAP